MSLALSLCACGVGFASIFSFSFVCHETNSEGGSVNYFILTLNGHSPSLVTSGSVTERDYGLERLCLL